MFDLILLLSIFALREVFSSKLLNKTRFLICIVCKKYLAKRIFFIYIGEKILN